MGILGGGEGFMDGLDMHERVGGVYCEDVYCIEYINRHRLFHT